MSEATTFKAGPRAIPRAIPWILATRPRTLPMSAAPVVAGAALAWHDTRQIAWGVLALTLVAAAAIQIGTNLYNDAADAERGVDRRGTRRGPPRAVAMGWLGARQVKAAALLSFTVAAVAGLLLVAVGGWPILAIGALGVVAGLGYSAGPLPMSATPFGEVLVMLFFGVAAVTGTYLLQTGSVVISAVVIGMMLGSFAAAVLHLNNTRDADGDRTAGRRTLAILLGPERSIALYAALVALPFILIVASPLQPRPWLALLAAPEASILALAMKRATTAADYNCLLGRCVRLEAIFTGALVLAMI